MRNNNKEVNMYLSELGNNFNNYWKRRGMLEAIKKTNPNDRRAVNQRFMTSQLPSTRRNTAGVLLSGIPMKGRALNYEKIKRNTAVYPENNNNMNIRNKRSRYQKLWAANKVLKQNVRSYNMYEQSLKQRENENSKKAKKLLKKTNPVAVRVTPSPKNPFTGKQNGTFVRNGNKSFRNLPVNIQTKILRQAGVTITPANSRLLPK